MASLLFLSVLTDLERNRRFPRNYLRNRSSAFDLPDVRYTKLFMLDKESVKMLCDEIKPYMPSSRIHLDVRVLAALRFFATGSYQNSVGKDEYVALSQQSVSKCIRNVSTAISKHLLQEFVTFPRSHEELGENRQKFCSISGFPGVIGAIDCTHVAIVTPNSSGSIAFINGKGWHSINVQLIVAPDLRIMGINARYPGSVHDAFIWRHSIAKQHVSQINQGWLVGDSGYPLEPWLMTPFLNPSPGSVEENYNSKLSSARVCVERCNGVLKARFRCLLKDRVLHYSPTAASHIINACAVLHNICVKNNIPMDVELPPDEDLNPLDPPSDYGSNSRAAQTRYKIALSISD